VSDPARAGAAPAGERRDVQLVAAELVDVALGSNLGDRAEHLAYARAAIAALPGTRILAATRVEETAPVGPAGQGAYLNQMLRVETMLAPHALLDRLLYAEAAAGRVRDSALRWGPRTLDCDIVRFGDRVMHTERLTVPHPELARRDWWQRELAELDAASVVGIPAAEPVA
jgi:2-amino-4-hydroxy-6-hydroxymethyldihydropteridine diphosphokinase